MQKNEKRDIIRVLEAMCDAIERNQSYLCELDGALGDGDHGVSMAKSFRAVRNILPTVEGQTPSAILRTVGMTLISEVGGAMGPLFGTAFLWAGKSVDASPSITAVQVAQMLAAAEAGVVQRGKAQPGDKTMVDALHPAVLAAQAAAAQGKEIPDVVVAAADAARAGAASTTQMIARIGRASRLGERTVGHQDAGATSVAILLAATAEAVLAIYEPDGTMEAGR